MLDLKVVDTDQYDLVPVPLPGRLIVFAGPDGLMCRRNDGTIANYPAPAGGGGGGAVSVQVYSTSAPELMPIPTDGTSVSIGMYDDSLCYRTYQGVIFYANDDGIAYQPPAAAPT